MNSFLFQNVYFKNCFFYKNFIVNYFLPLFFWLDLAIFHLY